MFNLQRGRLKRCLLQFCTIRNGAPFPLKQIALCLSAWVLMLNAPLCLANQTESSRLSQQLEASYTEKAVQAIQPKSNAAGETAQADIWAEIRQGFGLDAPDSFLVERFARDYAKKGFMESAGRRALPYLDIVLDQVKARKLPLELALLPFVESAFLPAASSPVGAHGPWQFMPATGNQYGLSADRLREERRNWLASSKAALTYLQSLYTRFGHWHLAIAAYNCGEGRVEKALEKARAQGKPLRFEAISLPEETRQYVPRLFAIARLIETPHIYGVSLPSENSTPLTPIRLDRDIDVNLAARFAAVSEKQLRQWNPHIQGPLITAAAHRELLLSIPAAFRLSDTIAASSARGHKLATWSLARLDAAMTLAEAATHFQVKAAQLESANPIAKGYRYRAGSTLLIPRRQGSENLPLALVQGSALQTEPAVKRISYKVRAKETLAQIAARYKVSLAEMQRWNPKVAEHPKRGTALTLWVPIS